MMIYPLTICFDRYNGVYSGGLYTAWNCDSENVPTEISDDDATCADFWRDVRNHHYTFLPTFGVGSTVEEAIENLRKKILGAEEDHDKETRASDIFCEENLDAVSVAKVREALGIAEDSDIFECIKYRNNQLETLRAEVAIARRQHRRAIEELDQFGKRLADIRKAAGMADGNPTDLVEYIKDLAKSRRETLDDWFGEHAMVLGLKDEILKVYREIFDCSNGDPEGTDEEALQDILTEYKRTLELKNAAEEKAIKYKELARENEEKANYYKIRLGNAEWQLRWTEEVCSERLKQCEDLTREREKVKRMEQKLIEIQDICER